VKVALIPPTRRLSVLIMSVEEGKRRDKAASPNLMSFSWNFLHPPSFSVSLSMLFSPSSAANATEKKENYSASLFSPQRKKVSLKMFSEDDNVSTLFSFNNRLSNLKKNFHSFSLLCSRLMEIYVCVHLPVLTSFSPFASEARKRATTAANSE
jgi:hypothetical protein